MSTEDDRHRPDHDFDEDPAQAYDEPEDDYDQDRMDADFAAYSEQKGPSEWWEDQLTSVTDSDLLQRSVEGLVSLGCREGDLLADLQLIYYASLAVPAPIKQVQLQLRAAKKLHALVEMGGATGPAFVDRWAPFVEELEAMIKDLEHEVTLRRRRPDAHRRDLLRQFIERVTRGTGAAQYQLITPLLNAVGWQRFTEAALRQLSSRAGVPASAPKKAKPVTSKLRGERQVVRKRRRETLDQIRQKY